MGIYIFDIDGTISENALPINKSIINSIEILSEKNSIIFASARPVRDMLPMVKETLHEKSIFIGCNGGMASRGKNIFYCSKLERNYVENALNFLKKEKVPYVLDSEWGFSLSSKKHEFHDYIKGLSSFKKEESIILDEGVTKILVLSNYKELDSLISKLSYEMVSIHIHTKEQIFDITTKGNNKYYTIKKLVDSGYTAFGNDSNDFLMLENAQKSVFIGNKDVFDKADFYLDFSDVDGFLRELVK